MVTYHGCEIQGVKEPDGRMTLAAKLLQRLCQIVAVYADSVITVSERIRSYVPASVPVSVLPLGLDFDSIPSLSEQEARRQFGLPLTERLVLFVGNPEETVKRYELAQQSVEVLNKRLPAKLIVGWGMSNRDILILMNACDVLVMTSMQEGSPTVIKEALACNLPIVSLDVGDVPERLKGVSGCEVCVDDRPETIATSLERVLRRGQRVNGREAVSNLDERLLTQRLIAIYRLVLANRKRKKLQR